MGQQSIFQTVQSKFSSAYGAFIDLLINQDKPAEQQGNMLYYVMDEQWTKLTAKDMRTALVNEKSEHRSSSRTPMPNFRSNPSSALMRSPMNLELASFKKSIKREGSAYSVLKDEHLFDKFQRDLLITAKSHDVSEILDRSCGHRHSYSDTPAIDSGAKWHNVLLGESHWFLTSIQ